jgi:hypothetical protein
MSGLVWLVWLVWVFGLAWFVSASFGSFSLLLLFVL